MTEMTFARPTRDSWAILALARFLLALVVLTGHVFCTFESVNGKSWARLGLYLNQGSAVFGFLIISGYSIAASLTRSSEGFYKRRLMRIAPIYYFSVFLALFITVIVGGSVTFPDGFVFDSPSRWQIASNLVMLQAIAIGGIPAAGQLWTIAVEWWLYMVAPFLIKLPGYAIALLAAGSLTYNAIARPPSASVLFYGLGIVCLSWYWLIGFFYFRHRKTWVGHVVLVAPVLTAYFFTGAFVGKAVFIGVAALLICNHVRLPSRVARVMEWLGDVSFPLYTIQICMMMFCHFLGIQNINLICAIISLTAVAVVYIIEIPVREKRWPFQVAWARIRYSSLKTAS